MTFIKTIQKTEEEAKNIVADAIKQSDKMLAEAKTKQETDLIEQEKELLKKQIEVEEEKRKELEKEVEVIGNNTLKEIDSLKN